MYKRKRSIQKQTDTVPLNSFLLLDIHVTLKRNYISLVSGCKFLVSTVLEMRNSRYRLSHNSLNATFTNLDAHQLYAH